ncbi:DegT/DnrJ/EryC1/StrS family aminotransferase [Streptomyces acidiscabies]|uniref:DegT/DnrJ/EryC1/StrS family aminotransferase n=1 Tax=Streptomyces acidiscabies TaxID=42234 RepID=A0AAP6BES5_9ACTN|nr:DegT/DnrJ/EryC1/StrS family aminotransferase [Streptomyces acidiscabies]MDX2963338.1 DegT/DnrJ/EryC1/StrS family aminotransferase [Streptomyces acidiscabies]MDX3023072.1 DegT/DnrJ/EryC1/StrS family aminotransferase [Streptomyces acidiscabies]MDX3792784.1 DegT/DnrJ/EryC1/StrS family aminotransferase [Streptomyces acidiscabies]GAQ51267.1 L-glutamine:2-deoxy-scyllo-inosose [Streptomyces acidiscabies]GAV38365.1 L-glutamine:2-deoxy-scyllo-inosose [Streptomyces acidiscabies]
MTDAPGMRYETWRALALWGDEEEAAALEVIRSRSLFRYYGPDLGHRTDRFEAAFSEAAGVAHTVAVSSGTAALTAAMIGLGIPAGAEVIVPAVTFVGSVGAVVAARAVPVFAEVDDSLTLDPTLLEERITERTWGVMPVHLGNVAADMDPLLEVARRRGLRVIEDAAQAAGVRYRGRPVGSLGDAGAFSFQLDKNITAGEGGAVTTADADVYDRVARYQDQGGQFTTSKGATRGSGDGPPFVGVNLRMTELTAAVLSAQLPRLAPMCRRLRDVARRVRGEVADLPVRWRRLPDEEGSGGDLTLFLDSRLQARAFVADLNAAGVPAHTMYQGQPVTANRAVREGRTPWGVEWERPPRFRISEGLLGRSVTIGLGAAMTDEDVDAVVTAFRKSYPAG